MEPLITTVILTYRRPELLKRAIQSALNQSYSRIQVHIYDNASGDETEAVVKRFMEEDSRVRYHCHSENVGMMKNYQFALADVKTPYFSLLSDDDVLFPWFYETVMQGFEEFPDSGFSAGSTIIMTPDGRVVRVPLDHWKREGYFTPPEDVIELITKYPVPTCVVFKRECAQGIPIDTSNTLVWDCDFLMQMAIRFPFFISKKPCGIFLAHPASFSKAKELDDWWVAHNKLIGRLRSSVEISPETQRAAADLISHDLQQVTADYVITYLMSHQIGKAEQAAELLRGQTGLTLKSVVFAIVIRMCRTLPPTFHILLLVRGIRRFVRKMRRRSPTGEAYEQYAKWL